MVLWNKRGKVWWGREKTCNTHMQLIFYKEKHNHLKYQYEQDSLGISRGLEKLTGLSIWSLAVGLVRENGSQGVSWALLSTMCYSSRCPLRNPNWWIWSTQARSCRIPLWLRSGPYLCDLCGIQRSEERVKQADALIGRWSQQLT